jgi:hypothetical protein
MGCSTARPPTGRRSGSRSSPPGSSSDHAAVIPTCRAALELARGSLRIGEMQRGVPSGHRPTRDRFAWRRSLPHPPGRRPAAVPGVHVEPGPDQLLLHALSVEPRALGEVSMIRRPGSGLRPERSGCSRRQRRNVARRVRFTSSGTVSARHGRMRRCRPSGPIWRRAVAALIVEGGGTARSGNARKSPGHPIICVDESRKAASPEGEACMAAHDASERGRRKRA